MPTYTYKSNKQLERFIGQFMRAMSGFHCRDGVDRGSGIVDTKIPVVYQTMDRLVASRMNERTRLKAPPLPLIGVNLNAITLNKPERRSRTHIHYTTTKPETDTGEVIELIYGPPVVLEMDVVVYASSKSELFEIVEQILLVFNPRLSITLDDSKANPGAISEINLTAMGDEIMSPIGVNSQEAIMNFTFEIPVRFAYPHAKRDILIEEIIASIKEESTGQLITQEIVNALDAD